jgi:hypothetical protein
MAAPARTTRLSSTSSTSGSGPKDEKPQTSCSRGPYPTASSRPATRTRCVRVRKTTGSGLREKPLRPQRGLRYREPAYLCRHSCRVHPQQRKIDPAPPAEFFQHGREPWQSCRRLRQTTFPETGQPSSRTTDCSLSALHWDDLYKLLRPVCRSTSGSSVWRRQWPYDRLDRRRR